MLRTLFLICALLCTLATAVVAKPMFTLDTTPDTIMVQEPLFTLKTIVVSEPRTVTADDGTVYVLSPPGTRLIEVAPGQTIRVGEACSVERVGFWKETKTCTWEATMIGTGVGIKTAEGGESITHGTREEVTPALIGICLMIVVLLLVLSSAGVLSVARQYVCFFFAFLAAVAAGLTFGVTSTSIAEFITLPAAAIALIIFFDEAGVSKAKKRVYAFGLGYIVLMVVAVSL